MRGALECDGLRARRTTGNAHSRARRASRATGKKCHTRSRRFAVALNFVYESQAGPSRAFSSSERA